MAPPKPQSGLIKNPENHPLTARQRRDLLLIFGAADFIGSLRRVEGNAPHTPFLRFCAGRRTFRTNGLPHCAPARRFHASAVAAPLAAVAKRVTDDEARFARLREHFSSRKCSISIRQTVCSLFPLPRATGTAGRCRLMHPKKIRPAVPLRFSRRSEASYRLRPDRRAPIARAVSPHPAFCEKKYKLMIN